jgi:predicted phosphodiesterase
MRIAVISDLHGNLLSLEAVLKQVEAQGVDLLICCGDLVAFGPHPLEVLDLLEGQRGLHVIRGNTDRWLETVLGSAGPYEEKVVNRVAPSLRWTLDKLGPRAGRFLAACPPSLEIGLEGLRTKVRHAGLDSDTLGIMSDADTAGLTSRLAEEHCDIFLCGHTHVPFWRTENGVTLVNAGSTALPFDLTPRPSWALLDIQNKTLQTRIFRVDYNLEAAIEDLGRSGMPMADVFSERIRNAKM